MYEKCFGVPLYFDVRIPRIRISKLKQRVKFSFRGTHYYVYRMIDIICCNCDLLFNDKFYLSAYSLNKYTDQELVLFRNERNIMRKLYIVIGILIFFFCNLSFIILNNGLWFWTSDRCSTLIFILLICSIMVNQERQT